MAFVKPLTQDANGDFSVPISPDVLDPSTLGTGLNSSVPGQVLTSSGAWDYAPIAGVQTVIFGSKDWARQCEEYSIATGSVTSNGTTTTLVTDQDSRAHKALVIFAACDSPVNSFDQLYVAGTVAGRAGTKTITFRDVALASGTSGASWNLVFAQRYSDSSVFRELNMHLDSSLIMSINASSNMGSTRMLAMLPTLIVNGGMLFMGDLGVQADIDAGSTANTISNIFSMIDIICGNRCKLVFEIPAYRYTGGSAANLAVYQTVKERVYLYGKNYSDFMIFDRNDYSWNRATQAPRQEFFKSDGQTTSAYAAKVYGMALSEKMRYWFPPQADLRAVSSSDRYGVVTSSRQLYDGGWVATGTAASTLNSQCSGTVDSEVTALTFAGNAASTVVCSRPQRTDGRGYDQLFTITGVAGDVFTVTIGGASNSLVSRINMGSNNVVSMDFSVVPGSGMSYSAPRCYVYYQQAYAGSSALAASAAAFPALTGDVADSTYTHAVGGEIQLPEFFIFSDGSLTTMTLVMSVTLQATGTLTMRYGALTWRSHP